MNQPDRYERFVLAEGVQKVALKTDTKVEDAATFQIAQEDHTMGNLIRMQLHEDKAVIFAGWVGVLPGKLGSTNSSKASVRGGGTSTKMV